MYWLAGASNEEPRHIGSKRRKCAFAPAVRAASARRGEFRSILFFLNRNVMYTAKRVLGRFLVKAQYTHKRAPSKPRDKKKHRASPTFIPQTPPSQYPKPKLFAQNPLN